MILTLASFTFLICDPSASSHGQCQGELSQNTYVGLEGNVAEVEEAAVPNVWVLTSQQKT